RPEPARDKVEQGRLAGAVRADDAERLALVEMQGEIVRHHQRAEALGDILQPDKRRHPRSLLSPALAAPAGAGAARFGCGQAQAIGSILPPTGMFVAVSLLVMTRSYLNVPP